MLTKVLKKTEDKDSFSEFFGILNDCMCDVVRVGHHPIKSPGHWPKSCDKFRSCYNEPGNEQGIVQLTREAGYHSTFFPELTYSGLDCSKVFKRDQQM
jgi:hypothetical protein